jgi:SAM-dependent methyltransferase
VEAAVIETDERRSSRGPWWGRLHFSESSACRVTTAANRIGRVGVQDYRRMSREVWQAMAPGWERWRAQLADALTPVRRWLIAELRSQPGETVLELGAGTGETGFEAAAILGEGGRLISSDFSPEMVEVARRCGTELGLSNVDFRVIDAERIELDADSVDGVLCQSTYMLVADPAAALVGTPASVRQWERRVSR